MSQGAGLQLCPAVPPAAIPTDGENLNTGSGKEIKQLSQQLLLSRMMIWGLQGMGWGRRRWRDGKKTWRAGEKWDLSHREKTSPEGAVLVMSWIHLPEVQKTSLQKDSPQKKKQSQNYNPPDQGCRISAMGKIPASPNLHFPSDQELKKNASFTVPF